MTHTFKVTNLHAGEARMELSKQWMSRPDDERYLSLDDLAAAVDRRETHREHVSSLNDFELAHNTKEVFVVSRKTQIERKLTHWSFGQLAQRAGAPASYLRTLPSYLATDCIREGLRHADHEENKFYYTADRIHAITSSTYGRIPDSSVVASVSRIAGSGLGDTRWKIPGTMDWSTMIYDPDTPVTKETTTLFAGDRDVWMFLVDDKNPIEVGKARNGEPDLMFRGFYAANSEVGAGTLQLATFYLRSLCCNRIMWGVEQFREIRIKHTRFAPDRFIREVAPALQTFGNAGSQRLVQGVNAAKMARIGDTDEEAVEFLRKFGLTGKRAGEVLKTHSDEEGSPVRTFWDAANGITAIARSVGYQDERVTLELQAKKLLDKVM